MSKSLLSIMHELSHLILTITFWSRCYSCTDIIDEERDLELLTNFPKVIKTSKRWCHSLNCGWWALELQVPLLDYEHIFRLNYFSVTQECPVPNLCLRVKSKSPFWTWGWTCIGWLMCGQFDPTIELVRLRNIFIAWGLGTETLLPTRH